MGYFLRRLSFYLVALLVVGDVKLLLFREQCLVTQLP